MKIAAVIAVAPPPQETHEARALQDQLLDRVGTELHSVRLAEPRLFESACRAAISECPDLLVAFCDTRLARRVGQIAHEQAVPIALACAGADRLSRTSRLCWPAGHDAIVDALSSGAFRAATVDACAANDELFFHCAVGGGVAQLAELRASRLTPFVAPGQRLAFMASLLHIRSLRMASKPRAPARAEAVEILACGAEAPEGTRSRRIRTLALSCWRPEGIGDWRHALTSALRGISPFEAANAEKFESAEGTIENSSRVWLLLDGDPVRLSSFVRVRIVPAAIEVATFAPSRAKLQHIPRMAVPEPT